MIFIFQITYIVCHIDLHLSESLHPWNKPHWIMVYDRGLWFFLVVIGFYLLVFCS